MIGFHWRGEKALLALSIGWSVLGATGCLGRSPDVRLFSMGTQSQLAMAERAPGVAVLIGPVRLPSELDRAQIVSRGEGGEVELDEFNRWIGGFETSFTRAVADNVRRQLGSVRVVGFPSQAPFPMDYRVRFHVDDFMVDAAGSLRVGVRWALIPERERDDAELLSFGGDYALRSGSPEAIVEAHDRALAALAQEIADRVVEALAAEGAGSSGNVADPE